MTNLAIKKNKKECIGHSLTLIDVMDSANNKADIAWFKSIMKSIFETNDLNLETFNRIEMKKTIQSANDYSN
jgi:hypothetical protein